MLYVVYGDLQINISHSDMSRFYATLNFSRNNITAWIEFIEMLPRKNYIFIACKQPT